MAATAAAGGCAAAAAAAGSAAAAAAALSAMLPSTTTCFPTSCVISCSNMLTPDELADPTEREGLKEDVGEECAQFGEVAEMKVPATGNAQCNVYVRFATPDAASRAVAALQGRKFDGRVVSVALFSEDTFKALVDG